MAQLNHVDILLFASLAEAAGTDRLAWEAPDGASVQDVIQWCVQAHPQLAGWETSMATAINEAYVNRDHPVKRGDTLALIPPVSGG